jgi:hypothetical protein
MGTSASFRAPSVPRWQAFTTALQQGLPLERVQSELFNAGADWEEALCGPAVAAFAAAIVDAHTSLVDQLQASERPEQAIQQALGAARQASEAEPASSATALAERAFVAVLTRAAAGETSLAGADAQAAAQHFAAARGTPADLLSGYVGELLGQYARHVTAREAGRLTEGDQGLTVSQTRVLTRRLAAAADEVGRSSPPSVESPGDARAGWEAVVRDAFSRGRRLPEGRR